jgi:uncharacterized protein YndB with AHSA1/START domain
MEKIESTIEIAAPPAELYRALTTTEGHRGWWTTDCAVGGAVGEDAVFRFDPMGDGGGDVTEMRFRIDRLEPDRSVAMTCVGQKNNPDWQDTRLTFTLSPSGSGTRVGLAHSAWRERNRVYDMCVGGWNHFLSSLKAYAETGTGTPHVRKKG